MAASGAIGLAQRLRALPDVVEVLTRPAELFSYESDGLTLERGAPLCVAFPTTAESVSAIVRACNEAGVPYVPRGAGTGLSGGASPVNGCVVIECARMDRVLEIDATNRTATVQPGVVNEHLSHAVRPLGLFYAPDPSSQSACTIGGNVAENSGGPHTLKYGTTSPHVLELVLAGRVKIAPFVERRPLSTIDNVFGALARHEITKRPVLVPDLS